MTCAFHLADSYVAVLCADSVADVFQDPKDLKKFYAWTDELREDGAEY